MTDFKPGIYFGMPAEEYHAVQALSTSGIKMILSSPMLFWARTPWLNAEAELKESDSLELGEAYHKRIVEGREVFYSHYAEDIEAEDHPDAIRSMDEIRALADEINAGLDKASQIKKSGTKADLIGRVREHRPDAEFWDMLVEEHAANHAGKTLLPRKLLTRIEIAAAMIEKHPQLSKAFTGGFPEVSIFWIDEETKVPMKARLDYLKTKAIIDLKSYANQYDKPVDHAVAYAVASYKYHIQVAVYCEAVAAAKAMIRSGEFVVQGLPIPPKEWVEAWIKAPEPEFLFVFQQTGIAPITRGKTFPRNLTFDIGKIAAAEAKRRYAECMATFGKDPWLDIADIDAFEDTDFPAFLAN